jgi:hypothetical protein
MKPVSQMTEEERLQEIASLLAIGAMRLLAEEDAKRLRDQPPVPARDKEPIQSRMEVWDLVDDEIEKQVLLYLALNILASPADLEHALSISHMTLARRLSRLRAAGFVHVSGRTRGAQYCLAAHHGTN